MYIIKFTKQKQYQRFLMRICCISVILNGVLPFFTIIILVWFFWSSCSANNRRNKLNASKHIEKRCDTKDCLNPNLGRLFWGWFWGLGDYLPTPISHPCLKFVRTMLETWNVVPKLTRIFSFRIHIF